MELALEASMREKYVLPDSIFKVKRVNRYNSQKGEEEVDSESSGFAHYFKCSQKSLKIGTLINPQTGELATS